MVELPHLIEVHPTRSVAIGALVPHPSGIDQVLLFIDLGYEASDQEIAREQLSRLPQQGFKTLSGVYEVYPPVYSWSYRADLGAGPGDTKITVLAEMKRRLVFSGPFISNPDWFKREATSRSTAVAIGNFSFLDDDPEGDDPTYFDGQFQVLAEAAMATSQVMGASIGRVARR